MFLRIDIINDMNSKYYGASVIIDTEFQYIISPSKTEFGAVMDLYDTFGAVPLNLARFFYLEFGKELCKRELQHKLSPIYTLYYRQYMHYRRCIENELDKILFIGGVTK